MLATALSIPLVSCGSVVRQGEQFAQEHGFEREIVAGTVFRHVVFRNPIVVGDRLHIYIEGDGSPYAGKHRIGSDPTPRRPLMLHLMALDTSPSLYIGRPCYWGRGNDSACNPTYWTLGRFNKDVIESVSAVIRKELAKRPAQHWSLYAHSGGAAIALLVARRIGTPERILTVGGNLDTDAWTTRHAYTPLLDSENPAVAEIPLAIPMTHYVGAEDTNTPPDLVRSAARIVGGEVIVVENFSHTCCWEKIWPRILAAGPVGSSRALEP